MVEEKTVEQKVIEAVAKIFKKDPKQITRDTRFVEDLYAKSLNIIELTAVLENTFGITISPIAARRNKTVGEAIDMIEKLLQK